MTSVSQLSALGFETAEVLVRKAKPAKPAQGTRPAQEATPDQYITVRGLSSHDVMRIVRVHGPSLVTTLTSVLAGRSVEDGANEALAGEFIVRLAEQVPDAIADLIVIASDDQEPVKGFDIAKRLPLPVQLKVIQEVVKLTLEDFGGLGELVETVVTMLGGMNGLVAQMTSSTAGAATSNEPSAS